MSLKHENTETLFDRIANEAHDTTYAKYTERLKNERPDEVIFADMFNRIYGEMVVRECAKSANDWYQNHDKIHSDTMSYVLAHFGVEE